MLRIYGIGGALNSAPIAQVGSKAALAVVTRGLLTDKKVIGVSLHGTLPQTDKPEMSNPNLEFSGEVTMARLCEIAGVEPPQPTHKACGCRNDGLAACPQCEGWQDSELVANGFLCSDYA
ncbi:MAG: hypothetical protein KAI66_26555 [Lentisphaeria bacterium]|nr:hypothetical protein [Lentisphaeria bacterium]